MIRLTYKPSEDTYIRDSEIEMTIPYEDASVEELEDAFKRFIHAIGFSSKYVVEIYDPTEIEETIREYSKKHD